MFGGAPFGSSYFGGQPAPTASAVSLQGSGDIAVASAVSASQLVALLAAGVVACASAVNVVGVVNSPASGSTTTVSSVSASQTVGLTASGSATPVSSISGVENVGLQVSGSLSSTTAVSGSALVNVPSSGSITAVSSTSTTALLGIQGQGAVLANLLVASVQRVGYMVSGDALSQSLVSADSTISITVSVVVNSSCSAAASSGFACDGSTIGVTSVSGDGFITKGALNLTVPIPILYALAEQGVWKFHFYDVKDFRHGWLVIGAQGSFELDHVIQMMINRPYSDWRLSTAILGVVAGQGGSGWKRCNLETAVFLRTLFVHKYGEVHEIPDYVPLEELNNS